MSSDAVVALDHVIVAVADLESATADYAALLGRIPSWTGRHPSGGTANALFRLDNTYVELLAPDGDGPFADAVRAHLEARGEGLFGLAFGVDDADEIHAQLVGAGLSPSAPRDGRGVDEQTGAERSWRNVLVPAADTRGVFLFAIEHTSPPEALPRVEPADLRSSVAALDHVVVNTTDADAAIALYRDALGLRLALDRDAPQWGARMLFFRVGGATVEVVQRLDDGSSPASSPSDTGPDRLWGLAWQVPDAEAARARLGAAGVDVSEVRDGRKPGTRVCTVRSGTAGVPTLLVEPAGR